MKEKLFTIPLMDAFKAEEECPFCFIERKLEQDALDFTLGSSASYMESDIREQTDEMGFCRDHFKKMYQYGNSLGNALILKTHFHKINTELLQKMEEYAPEKQSLFSKFKKNTADNTGDAISSWIKKKEESCFVCDYINNSYDRYLDTFIYLFQNEPDFITMIQNSKGFCVHHFGEITKRASGKLNEKQLEQYIQVVFPVMKEHMARLEGEIGWLVDKYDYRNANADWKNSKDALQRGMQKINGGYPADREYQSSR
jgi:hypothetical protein